MKPIVIIGSGLAGYGVAREFRKLNTETPLIIITADDGRAYSKPMLSNALAKNKTADQLATASAQDMAKQLHTVVRPNTVVSSIDADNHEVHLDGESIEYNKLVLALGANPIRLSIAGNASHQIYSVNNLQDYDTFRAAIAGQKSITILGGGLIGCEFANDLAANGYIVNVVDRNITPLGHLLPEQLGIKLQNALHTLGVNWLANTAAQDISHDGQHFTIMLENGKNLTSDVVLSAVGLRANTSLTAKAGLQIDRGIVVNELLQTSEKDIYALGDCAEVNDFFLPFIMPLMKCTKVLAQTLNGTNTRVSYPAMPVVVKTPVFPISFYPPPSNAEGQWQIEENEHSVRALFNNDEGQFAGFALGGTATSEASKLAALLPIML